MAAASLLALLDDIATVLDDVAVLTKVAAKKTAGVLGDDLALNAQQVTGVTADRELPVVWAVAKGSFLNKAILVPVALLISVFAPWLITPLLMVGGAYLCFEGFEKLAHKFLHSAEEDQAHHADLAQALADPAIDLVAFERDKIKGRDPHRLHPLRRNHRDHAGRWWRRRRSRRSSRCWAGISVVMTAGCLRAGRGHRQARRLRPVPGEDRARGVPGDRQRVAQGGAGADAGAVRGGDGGDVPGGRRAS